jgi:hypothetical protein
MPDSSSAALTAWRSLPNVFGYITDRDAKGEEPNLLGMRENLIESSEFDPNCKFVISNRSQAGARTR